jgi:hypothetical protein
MGPIADPPPPVVAPMTEKMIPPERKIDPISQQGAISLCLEYKHSLQKVTPHVFNKEFEELLKFVYVLFFLLNFSISTKQGDLIFFSKISGKNMDDISS